jgi:hypothetical protein
MTVCPIAIVAGCQKCPAFKICPLKGVLGDKPPASQSSRQRPKPAAKPRKPPPAGRNNRPISVPRGFRHQVEATHHFGAGIFSHAIVVRGGFLRGAPAARREFEI